MQRILMPVASLVGLVVLCILCLQCHAPHIEADLAERGRQQLAEAGLDPSILGVDGRDATLIGAVESEEQRGRAAELIRGVNGMRGVDNRLALGELGAGTSQTAAGASGDSTGSGAGEGALADPASGAEGAGSAGAEPSTGEASAATGASTGEDPAASGAGAGGTPGAGSTGTASSGSGTSGASEGGTTAGAASGGTSEGDTNEGAASGGTAAGSTATQASGEAARQLQTSLDAALRDRRVEFATNSDQLTPRGRAALDEIYELLAQRPQSRIAISGHTDLTGRSQYNLELSGQRARAARDYLVAKGLAGDRFTTEGYGSDRPIADNDTEAGRQRNRRIEFQVLENPQ
ncbi:MAG: OmpA family protein [Acidobacteriota bacterium]